MGIGKLARWGIGVLGPDFSGLGDSVNLVIRKFGKWRVRLGGLFCQARNPVQEWNRPKFIFRR